MLVYSLGTDKARWVVAIDVRPAVVVVRFLWGTLLDDPRGLLRGGTSTLMNVDLASADALEPAVIADFVAQAVARYPAYVALTAKGSVTLSGPTDQALAATVHAAILHYVSVLGSTAAGAVLEARDGLLSISSDLPIGNGNQVLVADDDATPAGLEAAIDADARRTAGRSGSRCASGTDDRFVPTARAAGLHRPRLGAGHGAPPHPGRDADAGPGGGPGHRAGDRRRGPGRLRAGHGTRPTGWPRTRPRGW